MNQIYQSPVKKNIKKYRMITMNSAILLDNVASENLRNDSGILISYKLKSELMN